MSESARDVMNAFCAEVAAALEPEGFRFVRSKRLLTRKRGTLTDEIAFVAGRNWGGMSIAFQPQALVRSEPFGEKRRELRTSVARELDVLAHNFLVADRAAHPTGWNLVDRERRAAITAEVVGRVRSDLLPWFAIFENESGVCRRLVEEEIFGIGIERAVEFLLCCAGRDAAAKHLGVVLEARPEWLDKANELLELGTREGLASVLDFPEGAIARSILRFELALPPGLRAPTKIEEEPPGLVRLVHSHEAAVVALANSRDGALLASSDTTGLVRLWDLKGRRELSTLQTGHARNLVFGHRGDVLIVHGAGEVMTLVVPTLGAIDRCAIDANALGSVLSSDGAFIVSKLVVGNRTSVCVRTLPEGEERLVEDAPGLTYFAAVPGALAMGSSELGPPIELPPPPVPGVNAFSVRAWMDRLEIRALPSFTLRRSIPVPHPFGCPELSSSGRFVAGPHVGTVWDLESGETCLQFPHARPSLCTFSRDSSLFASVAGDAELRVWETSGWSSLAKLSGRPFIAHHGNVTALAFSSEGHALRFGAGDDGKVYEWTFACH